MPVQSPEKSERSPKISFKHPSYGSSEEIGRILAAMDRDPIIDDSSIDGTSEYWHGPKSEPSSPDNRSTRFGHSMPSCTPLRDMWLGQKYLESVIALQLHSLADAEDIVPELQVCSNLSRASA